jgi:hypothetical protein
MVVAFVSGSIVVITVGHDTGNRKKRDTMKTNRLKSSPCVCVDVYVV